MNDLRQRRTGLFLTQKEVADSIGISRVAYTNIELGKRKPSVTVAKKIAEILNIDWTLFFKD